MKLFMFDNKLIMLLIIIQVVGLKLLLKSDLLCANGCGLNNYKNSLIRIRETVSGQSPTS